MFASTKGKQQSKFDSYSVRNSAIDHIPYRLFTIPYFLVRSFRYTASYRHSYCTEGVGEKNERTVITSLQLAFTERVLPATQAFGWSLDNRC